jgi:hypothetical protein
MTVDRKQRVEDKNEKSNDLNNVNNNLTTSSMTVKTAVNPPNTSPGNVNVVCRFRPLNEKEKNMTTDLCVEFIDQ